MTPAGGSVYSLRARSDNNIIMLELQQLVGAGKERACYQHPDEPDKAVKVLLGPARKQMDRELQFYAQLNAQGLDDYTHIPRYYGEVETNHGTGYVMDLVRDYDGSVSRRLSECFFAGEEVADFAAELEELRQYLRSHRIIFNHDMYEGNILARRLDTATVRLVVIDGLGEVTFLQWPNRIATFARQKIARRWSRFYARMEHNHAAIQRGKFL